MCRLFRRGKPRPTQLVEGFSAHAVIDITNSMGNRVAHPTPYVCHGIRVQNVSGQNSFAL
jgi:hypothetical protein